ncbi:MAG: hypothetical protein CML56_03985 [Rhodobacteraceae bacterium]|nr:hypothetical protein [Paracoccaceae bacterium]
MQNKVYHGLPITIYIILFCGARWRVMAFGKYLKSADSDNDLMMVLCSLYTLACVPRIERNQNCFKFVSYK